MSDDEWDFIPPEITDQELLPIIPLDHDTGMMQMRDYQQEAVDAVFSELNEHESTLLVLATGLGKTICFAELAYRWPVGRVLIIAHREELIDQAAEKVGLHLDEHPAIEMGDRKESRDGHGLLDKSKVLVTSVQTMSRPNRIQWFNPMDFGLIVTDECFVAGTEIDGIPIENIAADDYVKSVNHMTHEVERKRVVRLFRNPVRELLRITISDGSTLVCTPNHPVCVLNEDLTHEYIAAKYLSVYDVVHCITQKHEDTTHGNQAEVMCGLRDGIHSAKLEQHNGPNLFAGVQADQDSAETQSGCDSVPLVQNRCGVFGSPRTSDGKEKEGVLLGSMPRSIGIQDEFRTNGGNQSEVRIQENDRQESNERPCCQGEDADISEGDGVEAANSGRQRSRSNGFSIAAGVDARVGYGSDSQDGHIRQGWERTAIALQAGHRESNSDDCDRGRRQLAQCSGKKTAGSKEDGISTVSWVVGVEVLERGSDGTFGGLCPDGHVYNFEVEDNNNYFANGILVHNCHHGTSASYRRVYEHFHKNPQLRHVGVTATPKRADEAALGDIYRSVAYEMDIRQGIDEGWLVDVEQKMIVVEGLDFSRCRTTAGDLNQKDIAAAWGFEKGMVESDDMTEMQREQLEHQEKMLHAVVSPVIQESQGRPTIIFATTKDHAERLCEICLRHPGVTAEFVTDDTDRTSRKEIITRFRTGRTQIFVNVGIATEGFDARVDVVAIARPTKSEALYRQMIGRGTRPLPGSVDKYDTAIERREAIANSVKPAMTVLDFLGASGRHNLISAVDVLGGSYTEDVIEAAKRKLRESGTTRDIDELLAEEAQNATERKAKAMQLAKEKADRDAAAAKRLEEERLRRQEEWDKRKSVRGHATYRAENVSPFESITIPEQVGVGKFRGGSSDKQIKLLMCLGVSEDQACKYSKGQAGSVIDKLRTKTGAEYIVTIGKHKGRALKDVPSGWVDWAEKNISDQRMLSEIRNFRRPQPSAEPTLQSDWSEEAPF